MEVRRRYGGQSAEERRAARRMRLVDSALELFGTRGYTATTIEQLCSAAGVTARHFYEEFSSREALLFAVYDAIALQCLAELRQALHDPQKGWYDVVQDGLTAYFGFVTADPRRARILFMETAGVSRELEIHRRAMLTTLVRDLTLSAKRLLDAGLTPSLDTELLCAALAGAAYELTIFWLLADERPAVATLVELMAAIWVRSLELDRLAPQYAHEPPPPAAPQEN